MVHLMIQTQPIPWTQCLCIIGIGTFCHTVNWSQNNQNLCKSVSYSTSLIPFWQGLRQNTTKLGQPFIERLPKKIDLHIKKTGLQTLSNLNICSLSCCRFLMFLHNFLNKCLSYTFNAFFKTFHTINSKSHNGRNLKLKNNQRLYLLTNFFALTIEKSNRINIFELESVRLS